MIQEVDIERRQWPQLILSHLTANDLALFKVYRALEHSSGCLRVGFGYHTLESQGMGENSATGRSIEVSAHSLPNLVRAIKE